jgi:tetratricopeptide (TPR) repeat protein
MSTYRTARIADLRRDDGWAPIRLALDVQSFGINSWTGAAAGDAVIPEHDEQPTGHEELYLVVAGHAAFTVAGEEIDGPTGTVVLVQDPSVRRGAVAKAAETTVLSVGAKPGEPYAPRSWEVDRDVVALLEAGRPAEAKAMLLEALERYDDEGALLYNLACAEALLGEHDVALDHLRQAIAGLPAAADWAREDTDLDPLRADPRFAEIVGLEPA